MKVLLVLPRRDQFDTGSPGGKQIFLPVLLLLFARTSGGSICVHMCRCVACPCVDTSYVWFVCTYVQTWLSMGGVCVSACGCVFRCLCQGRAGSGSSQAEPAVAPHQHPQGAVPTTSEPETAVSAPAHTPDQKRSKHSDSSSCRRRGSIQSIGWMTEGHNSNERKTQKLLFIKARGSGPSAT